MAKGSWTPTRPRGPIAAEFQTPGPGSCDIPSSIGKESPAFSMASRREVKNKKEVPAPNEYNTRQLTNKGKDVAPAQTIAARPKDPKAYQTPAPGTYEVEDDYKFVAEAAPRFSFGTKNDVTTPNIVPAPNAYDPKCEDNGPKYAMQGRPKQVKKFQTPAPGSYEVDDDYDYTMESSPSFSFGQKNDISRPNIVPAPNAYDANGLDDGPSFSMPGRAKDRMPFTVPAPGTYDVTDEFDSTMDSAPRYSFGQKNDLTQPNIVPSPNAYDPKCEDNGPKYTMPSRPKEAKKFQTPAPGTYEVDDDYDYTMESSPSFSFGQKNDVIVPNIVPAPNTYTPKGSDPGPKYTMPGRGRDPSDERTKFPAPGTYEPANADVVLNKSPAYTMRERTALPLDRTKKPAPNAYSPDDKATKPRDAQHSFGMRHSPYLGSLKPASSPERAVSMQTSAIRPTDKVLRGGEVVRVTSDGLTCRWVDRGLSPRTTTSTTRSLETRNNLDASTTTRETTRVHRTVQMTVQ